MAIIDKTLKSVENYIKKPSDGGSVGGDSRTAKGNPCNAARINKLYREFQEAGKISNPRENVLIFRTVSDDVLHFITTRIVRLDPTNARCIPSIKRTTARNSCFRRAGIGCSTTAPAFARKRRIFLSTDTSDI